MKPYFVIRRKDEFWKAGEWVANIYDATRFENSERQNVRLFPGERWEKI